MNQEADAPYEWLETGAEMLQRMLAAISAARESIRLEMYIVHGGATGSRFRDALIEACRRGVRVRVLVDAMGSLALPESFWSPMREAGGEFRWFNPLTLNGWSIRDHRKILVCDDRAAFVGGVNVGSEYAGDGVAAGWRDLGMAVRSPVAGELSAAFDKMFDCADFRHPPFARLRESPRQKIVAAPAAQLLLGGPSRNNPIKLAVRRDLALAFSVRIVSAYFLPPWRIRRELGWAAQRGARVQLVLPGKSDLPFTRLAGQTFYRRLLMAGVEIYEYQPQILHAKMLLIDDIVYVGSANVDHRALNINYELMLRLSHPALARQGAEIFERILAHCQRIELNDWREGRTFFERCRARLAYLLLARLDPMVARWQWQSRRAEKKRQRTVS
ncbi:MAG TPA: phospholipase D-like domain-containing protein [Verrucomicrobiae bacterium]|jgi:cardiolipin synthase